MSSSSSSLSSLLSSMSGSSSSLDISSILQAAFGASSPGIDVTAAVNSGIAAARAPENAWSAEETLLQGQTSALTQVQTDVTNLDNDLQSLNSITGPLSAMTVTSSNSNVVSGTAASGSAAGSHVLVVNSLATTGSWTSGAYGGATTALPAGSFSITTATGSATITADGTQTLSDVANEINGDKLGITASVITDANGARLAIVSNSSGSKANFTVAPIGTVDYGFAQVKGADASITVDGINIASSSNTVTGVISGVTLNLQSANPGVQVSLGVAPDTYQVQNALQQFVTDYNTVVSDMNAQFTFSGTSEGVLATDSTIRNLQSDVLSALNYTATPSSGTTTVPNLSSLGIQADQTGKLSLNTATLQSVLQNNHADVQNFFQGTALNGFANAFDQQLTSFISPANGAFTVDLHSLSTQYTDMQTNISNFETNYIATLKTQLQSDYSQAAIALQQLPNEMKQINLELGYNNSSNG